MTSVFFADLLNVIHTNVVILHKYPICIQNCFTLRAECNDYFYRELYLVT